MMNMFEKMLSPLKNAHIILLSQAAQSGNLPSFTKYVGPHRIPIMVFLDAVTSLLPVARLVSSIL
jgi:hypothetical protein